MKGLKKTAKGVPSRWEGGGLLLGTAAKICFF